MKQNNTVQTRLLDRRKDTRHFNQTVSRPRHGRAESVHLTTSQRDEVRRDRGSVDRDRGSETPDTNTETSLCLLISNVYHRARSNMDRFWFIRPKREKETRENLEPLCPVHRGSWRNVVQLNVMVSKKNIESMEQKCIESF